MFVISLSDINLFNYVFTSLYYFENHRKNIFGTFLDYSFRHMFYAARFKKQKIRRKLIFKCEKEIFKD